jgi:hypothetical protein
MLRWETSFVSELWIVCDRELRFEPDVRDYLRDAIHHRNPVVGVRTGIEPAELIALLVRVRVSASLARRTTDYVAKPIQKLEIQIVAAIELRVVSQDDGYLGSGQPCGRREPLR